MNRGKGTAKWTVEKERKNEPWKRNDKMNRGKGTTKWTVKKEQQNEPWKRNRKMDCEKGMTDTKGAALLKKEQQNENDIPLEKE